MIGTSLNQYQITARLGAGGMGEVYRARDTKLNRDVAIKVLPEALAPDPQPLPRFHRASQGLPRRTPPTSPLQHGGESSRPSPRAGGGAVWGSAPRRPDRAGPNPPKRGPAD